MKKLIVFFLLLIPLQSQATFIAISPGVVQDTFTNQYWYQDLSAFIGQTYLQQIDSIDEMGTYDWRMATQSDVISLTNNYSWGQLAVVFEPTSDTPHWKGRYDQIFNPTAHHEINMSYTSGEYSGGINIGVADSATFPGAFVTLFYGSAANPSRS